MATNILLVGIGGMVGSILRYLIAVLVAERSTSTFPYGTLIANISGCFLIGLFVALSEKGNFITPEWRLLLTAGFCGGFTTFSAFSYETLKLMQDGQLLHASLNVALSVVIGFGATFLGMFLVRSI